MRWELKNGTFPTKINVWVKQDYMCRTVSDDRDAANNKWKLSLIMKTGVIGTQRQKWYRNQK